VSALRGRAAVALVARREIRERLREKSFLVSTGVTMALVVLVATLPPLLGVGDERYTVGATDARGLALARVAAERGQAFDADVTVKRLAPDEAAAALRDGEVDFVLSARGLSAQERPDAAVLEVVEAADREVRQAAALQRAGLDAGQVQQALNPPPLRVTTVERYDPERERKGGFAFFAVLALYVQLLTFGYWLAAGVVEEKVSRVVEVLLAAIRPRDLLAGKIIGLGVLGFAQVVAMAGLGLGAAAASGALDVSRDIVVAAALAVAWFVLGYAFYAGLFACSGAIVPRQEELQSSMTPLTMVILISFFVSFAVLDNPDGTLAKVSSLIPFSAPMTMPPRIALGEASAVEIVAAFAITAAAAIALVPLAGRIYRGAVLRTGSAVKLREAWRARA